MANKNNILYLSSVCSEQLFDYLLKTSSDNPGQAIQKFHTLLITGLAMQENNIVEALTSIPVTPAIHTKRFWNLKPDYLNKVKFNYTIAINFPIIKNMVVCLSSFLKVLFWKSKEKGERPIIICDALKRSLVAGAYFGAKLRNIKMIAIVTDMPGLDVFEVSFKKKLATDIARFFLKRYDGYILSTIQMNSIVNPVSKPKMVMEGLVDKTTAVMQNQAEMKNKERNIIYAGGIYERYGIKRLIEAFIKLDLEHEDIRLDIYGSGPMEKDMPKYMSQDNRIRYFGIVPNAVIVEKQKKATLLVNPRPSNEEYAKYSFPSKNMEYMASGTPVVTTHLPGMPDEYLPFVYLFQDESSEGMYKTLHDLLNKPRSELCDFGFKAKNFIINQKNNYQQAQRITNFIDQIV